MGLVIRDDCIEVFTLESAWDESNGLLDSFLFTTTLDQRAEDYDV